MVDVIITSAVGVIEAVVDMINPEIDENMTVMEYKELPDGASDALVALRDQLEGHFQRKIESDKTYLFQAAQAYGWDVTWRNHADGSTGTWFNEFSGSVSSSGSMSGP